MAQETNKTGSQMWKEYVARSGSFFATSMNRKWIRSILVTVLFVMFVWLVYSQVYSTLKQDVPLPVSVDRTNPSLDLRALQAINKQRVERAQRERPDYLNFSRVFAVPKENE
jgi:hypothetical protein